MPRLVHRLAQAAKVAIEADQIEEIAGVPRSRRRRSICAGRTRTVIGTGEPHIKTAAWGIPGASPDDPVTARTAPVGQVMTRSHGLGVAREAAAASAAALVTDHIRDQRAARLRVARRSGWRSKMDGKDCRATIFGSRHKEPQAPGDDLRDEAERFQLRYGAVREAGELDATCAHHGATPDLQAAGEIKHGTPFVDGGATHHQRRGGPSRPALARLDAEAFHKPGRAPRANHETADHALAVLGLKAVQTRMFSAGRRSQSGSSRPVMM